MNGFKCRPPYDEENYSEDDSNNRERGIQHPDEFSNNKRRESESDQEEIHHHTSPNIQHSPRHKNNHKISRITIKRIKTQIESELTTPNHRFVQFYLHKLKKEILNEHPKWTLNKKQINELLKLAKEEFKKILIGENVVKAITSFLFKYEQTINIHIEHDILKIRILTEKKTHCENVFHVYKLQDEVLRCMANSSNSVEQLTHFEVEKNVVSLFNNLLKILKFYLFQEEVKLKSLDFLYSEENITQNSKPIYIGGLKYTCFKFFKTFLKTILELIIANIDEYLPKEENEQEEMGLTELDFKIHIKEMIEKMKENEVTEDITIQTEMSSKLHPKVIQNFEQQIQNLSLFHPYDSFQSFKLHLIENAFYEFDGKEIITNKISNKKLTIKNVKLSGKLKRKKNPEQITTKKNKSHKYFDTELLDFNVFESISSSGGNCLPWVKKRIIRVINEKDKVSVIFCNSGQFYIFAQEKEIVKKYKNILKRKYSCDATNLKCEYCFEGKLNLENENIFGYKLSNIISDGILRNQAEKIIYDRKNHIEETRNYLDNKGNIFEPTKYQFERFITLSYSNKSQLGNIKHSRKISFYIEKEGYFKLTGARNKKSALRFINELESEIREMKNKEHLEGKVQKYNSEVGLEKVVLKGDSHLFDASFQQFIRSGWTQKEFFIKELDMFKENQKITYEKSDISPPKIKILIWNIQSMKYIDTKNTDRMIPKKLEKWIQERLETIVEEINKQNAHFVCIQEPQIFYDKNYNKQAEFIENLIKKFEGNYYCSRIILKENESSEYRNWKSVILSRISVKFYELDYNDKECLNNTMCEFYMQINGIKFHTILVSIHLKSEEKNHSKRIRQLEILKKVCNNFEIAILAGDFNIGENYPENNDEFLKEFIDLDKFFLSEKKPFTHFNTSGKHQRYDRILIRIKNKDITNSLLARPEEIGKFSSLPYQEFYIEKNESGGEEMSLSDHYGRLTEIMFKNK